MKNVATSVTDSSSDHFCSFIFVLNGRRRLCVHMQFLMRPIHMQIIMGRVLM